MSLLDAYHYGYIALPKLENIWVGKSGLELNPYKSLSGGSIKWWYFHICLALLCFHHWLSVYYAVPYVILMTVLYTKYNSYPSFIFENCV